MATTNIFGDLSTTKAKSKWSVSDFVSQRYNTRSKPSQTFAMSSGASQSDVMELDRVYRAIETETTRLKLDYDKIYREMDLKRKELKQDIDHMRTSGAKGQDLSLMHNADINLMSNQMRIVDSKRMLLGDRFKNIRDEKKLYMDKLKAEGKLIPDKTDINVVQATNTNSALAAAQAGTGQARPVVHSVSVSAPKDIIYHSNNEHPKVSLPEVIQQATNIVSTPTPTIEKEIIPEADVVVREDLRGNVKTLGEQQQEVSSIMQSRLQQTPEESLSADTVMGFDLKSSLNSMLLLGENVQEKMFINPNTGTYYIKAYRKDDNGKFTIEEPRYHNKSIIHIGAITIDTFRKQVKMALYDDAIPYELVTDNTNQPDFYTQEWADSKTTRFILDEDTCLRLQQA